MRTAIAAFVATLLTFLLLDIAWLTQVAIGMYQRALGGMLRSAPSFPAIIAFYLIYASALTALAVMPGIERDSILEAAWRSALLGFAAYATYDLTNYATLKDYPLPLALADLAWGTFASATAGCLGYLAGQQFR